MITVVGLALWSGCTTTTTATTYTCTVDGALSTDSAAVGATVVFAGGPLTESSDTRVLVGGVPASNVVVTRDECTLCDACREASTSTCSPCGRCAPCEDTCATCVQTVSFVIPEVAPGLTRVTVLNAYGATEQPLTIVEAAVDSDAPDTDASAPETSDSDSPDTDSTTIETAAR